MTQSILVTGPAESGKTRFATELLVKDAKGKAGCFAFYPDMERQAMFDMLTSLNIEEEISATLTVCSALQDGMSLEHVFEITDWSYFDYLLIDDIESIVDVFDSRKVLSFLSMLKKTETNLYVTAHEKRGGTIPPGSSALVGHFDYVVSVQKSRN